MLNKWVGMGRMTKHPELRFTQTGKPVASFAIAVNRDHNREEVDFIDCVAWNGTAEFVNKYFTKGSMAVVSGRLQMREWTDKNNNRRISAEIIADNVYFAESKRDSEKDSTGEQQTVGNFEEITDDDDGLPF